MSRQADSVNKQHPSNQSQWPARVTQLAVHFSHTGWLLLILIGSSFSSTAFAQQNDCADALALQHSFSSGATWSLCAAVNNDHGLTVSSVHYQAPGDSSRSVLGELHLGQLLLHYHDAAQAEPQIRPAQSLETPTSSEVSRQLELTKEQEPPVQTAVDLQDDAPAIKPVRFNEQSCDGEHLGTASQPGTICAIIKNNRTLAKYAQRPSLNSQSWELASAFARDALIWTSAVTFTEDGQIRPAVRLSGRASRSNVDTRYAATLPLPIDPLTRATVLATWRMVFKLDTDTADKVEQFDFPLDTEGGNRRPMRVSPITTETLRRVDRQTFRGWRIVDVSGAGYYLDPSNSGFTYSSRSENWAQFDMAFSRLDTCERYALLNNGDTSGNCGTGLDDFVNGESLTDAAPVVWYSQMRNVDLTLEDWPVISELALSFDLLPFDWTASSPFELIE